MGYIMDMDDRSEMVSDSSEVESVGVGVSGAKWPESPLMAKRKRAQSTCFPDGVAKAEWGVAKMNNSESEAIAPAASFSACSNDPDWIVRKVDSWRNHQPGNSGAGALLSPHRMIWPHNGGGSFVPTAHMSEVHDMNMQDMKAGRVEKMDSHGDDGNESMRNVPGEDIFNADGSGEKQEKKPTKPAVSLRDQYIAAQTLYTANSSWGLPSQGRREISSVLASAAPSERSPPNNQQGLNSRNSSHSHYTSQTDNSTRIFTDMEAQLTAMHSTIDSQGSISRSTRVSGVNNRSSPRIRSPAGETGGGQCLYQGSINSSASARRTDQFAVSCDDGMVPLRDFIGKTDENLSHNVEEGDGGVHQSGLKTLMSSMRGTFSSVLPSVHVPSRDIIAGIEAEMLLLQQGQGKEGGFDSGANTFPKSKLTRRSSRDDVSGNTVTHIQGHQQKRQYYHETTSRTNIDNIAHANQMSDIATAPHHMADDDDASTTKTITSYASYDGKCTHIYAIQATTQREELACHELNDAICDVYGAPVKLILKQVPMVTRLIRGDDEMGNIQLHYAVRHGNVKAIRRIVRADPACALIRNVQGYCPLHFAVQIGHYAAAQLLCSIAPTSAEVQCEEGNLPLHEAVSLGADLPDAPQIAAALISVFPAAIKITNDEGLLPLHLAAMSGFSAGIRTIFAFSFSTVYARENTEEMLPLDFAIDGYRSLDEDGQASLGASSSGHRNDADMSLEKRVEFRNCIDIFLMSALYDRPVFTADHSHMAFLPIHGAAASQPCSQSWKQLISMYGEEHVSKVDIRGRTALHVLVTSELYRTDLALDMIKDIHELDATNVTIYDDSGLTPLHAAIINRAPLDVVECLLRCNYGTLSMEVNCDSVEYCGMLPFQLAAAGGCSADIVNLLLRSHPIGVMGALNS